MRQTSLMAYEEIIEAGQLAKQENQVYRIIAKAEPWRGVTDNEISLFTGIKINAVCGRRNGLYKKGLIRCIGKRPCQRTKRYCMAWVVFE